MVTLWPIPEEAREALQDGEHIKLTNTGYPENASVVLSFEESTADSYGTCDWEIENGWKEDSE